MQTASTSLRLETSYHAGFASKKMLEELTDTPVELEFHLSGATVCHFSKKPLSSLSASLVKQLTAVKFWSKPMKWESSLTVTNVPGSTLSREANHTMLLHAGPEIAVASTKAYTAQIAALAFLAKSSR